MIKLLDRFNECAASRGYNQTRWKVDWKIVGTTMYFRQTAEPEDWVRNILAAIPFPARVGRRWLIVPLGALLGWLEVKKIVRENPVELYIGYSQGGWYASYSSLEMGKKANTFGCPGLMLGNSSAVDVFENVVHYETPIDLVTRLPPWARKGKNVRILTRPATRPDHIPEARWALGHEPDEYRQRLTP